MPYFSVQVIILFLFFVLLATFAKYKTIRFFVIFVGGLFLILQIVSLAFNGALIDYRFYDQANLGDIWTVSGFFDWYIVVFTLLFIVVLFLMNFLILKVKKRRVKPIFSIVALFVLAILLFLPKGVGTNIYEIVHLKSAKVGTFPIALEELGIDPKEYTAQEEIEAHPGKNIIVLSLESLERDYLEPPFLELTPNLRALAEKYTYLKMDSEWGSRGTSTSMYTALTGMPAYFKGSGNSTFQNTKVIQIGNLGSVLQEAGYEMSYLLANKNFSGMNDMLQAFGFEVISEADLMQDYELSEWGAQDKDMFEKLKNVILNKQNKGKPYAIYLSTISGHYPDGVYDRRMEAVLPKRDTGLEFMTSAVDYYIGDLFEFLEKNDLLKSTEVFIYPDHELMGSVSKVLEKFSDERGLYVITTADKNKVLNGVQQPVMQIDIPQIIINGAGIQTNATFLSSFIPKDRNKSEYINENKKKLLVLNEAAINRENYKEGFRFEITDYGKLKLSALENESDEFFLKPANNRLSIISFTEDFRFQSHKVMQSGSTGFPPLKSGYSEKGINQAFSTPAQRYSFIYSVVNDSLFGYLKGGRYLGIARNGEGSISFSKNDISALSDWKALQKGSELKPNELFLKSTGLKSIVEYGTSQIYLGFKPLEVKRGVNLLYLDNDNTYKIYNTDYAAEEIAVKNLLDTIGNLIESQHLTAILVHDTSVRKLVNFEDVLKSFGLPKLAKLDFRQPYLAFFRKGSLIEKTGKSSIQTTISFKEPAKPDLSTVKKDTMRFIAHAGGGINGDTYTNSLEAMNLSYEKGFRLFELDFVKTSDNIFVAGRNWESWKRRSDYKGEIPPDLKTFKENPTGSYTPMDIYDVNQWFRDHPGTLLITDKTNDPTGFVKAFFDKDRLWMELFSLEAAKEAQKLEIEVLLTQAVLENLEGKELEKLWNLGIHRIAISRGFIKDNISLLAKLKKAGIKAYAYHLYGEFDVDYMLKYEIDYIYGMYTDEWNFGNLTKPKLD